MGECVLRRSMTPAQRTPQQRDRRFARVRHVTQVIFLGSFAASALFVGYAANAAKATTTSFPTSIPTTTSEPPTTTSVTTTTIRRSTTTTAPTSATTTPRSVTTTPRTVTTVRSTHTTVRRVTPTTVYTPPTTAPVTTTTTCASTPSGRVFCF